MTWAAEAEQRGYKVESMLNRLRGVARRHWAVTIRFVSLSLVVQAAQGLVREHIDAHGADSLRRRSKEPFDTAEIVAILNLPVGTHVTHGSSVVTVGENLEWQGVVVFINLYCTGGWRKEAIALGPKEVFGGRKLSLGEVTYRIGGVLHREPTVQQLLRITWNDLCYINPVPCKNDPDNSKFGSSPVPSRYHATQPICLVRELAKYEIMRMREWLEETLALHSGKSAEEVNRDIERDKILTAAAAKEYGIVDHVLESRKIHKPATVTV